MSEQRTEHTRRPSNRLRLIDRGAGSAHERRRLEELLAPLRGPLLTVSHRRMRGVEVFAARGEIDLSTAPRFADALRATVQEGSTDVVIDLTDVTFMDSTGVHLLSRTFKQLGAQQRRLAIACHNGGAVYRVLSLSAMLAILSVHPSRESALAWRDEQLMHTIPAAT